MRVTTTLRLGDQLLDNDEDHRSRGKRQRVRKQRPGKQNYCRSENASHATELHQSFVGIGPWHCSVR